jgi:hypothetical protein
VRTLSWNSVSRGEKSVTIFGDAERQLTLEIAHGAGYQNERSVWWVVTANEMRRCVQSPNHVTSAGGSIRSNPPTPAET